MAEKQPGCAQACAGLWGAPLCVVNIGLELFGETLELQGIPVVNVDWNPPAGGRRDIMDVLDSLRD